MKILLFLLLAPVLVFAHPHQWIDLRITPETDASGALTALITKIGRASCRERV